jgi:hypothetical protein
MALGLIMIFSTLGWKNRKECAKGEQTGISGTGSNFHPHIHIL